MPQIDEAAGGLAAESLVSSCKDRKIVEHPLAGPVTVGCDVLTDGDTELKIVILTAAPGTEDEQAPSGRGSRRKGR